MTRLADFIREECNPLGTSGAQNLRLIGVSNEHGLHGSSRDTSDDLSRYQRIERNWFAYNPMRVNVGSIGLADDELKTGFTSPDYTVFSCREGLDPHYLLHFLKSDYGLEAIARNCSGAVRKRLYYSGLSEIDLPIPSIVEQRALVARIHRIGETIRFIREENSDRHELPKLKQAILQEAIAGKLTADWRAAHPDVEPASQLLHRIQAEKARLIAAKKLRPEKPLPKITPAEIPFEIPNGWEWCRIANATLTIVDCPHSTPSWTERGRTCVKTGQFQRFHLDLSSRFFVSEETYQKRVERLVPEPGDILYSREGGILGIACRIPDGEELCLGQRMMLLRAHHPTTSRFLELMLNAPHVTQIAVESTLGGCAPHINVGEIKSFAIPLPPLPEQLAIVERVESLMQHCRALSTEIEHTRTHAAHLLQAVLKEAFAPASP